MTQPIKPMTTSAFAKAAGISTATVSKLIREGKIKAKKEGKAWMIPPSQLEAEAIRAIRAGGKSAKAHKPSKAPAPIKTVEAPGPGVAEPELPAQTAASAKPAGPGAPEAAAPQPASEPTPDGKSYSIAEFAAMTYLTEKGVFEWLQTGRLKSCRTEKGEWRVLESNLSVSDISRLVRK